MTTMTAMPWWKMYAGSVYDPKWLAIGDVAGSTPEMAAMTYFAACDYACEHREDPGSLEGFNPQDVASFFKKPLDLIKRIFEVLIERSMIVDNHIRAWVKRQVVTLSRGDAGDAGVTTPVTPGAARTRKWRAKKAEDRRQGSMMFSFSGGRADPGDTSPLDKDSTETQRFKESPPAPPQAEGSSEGVKTSGNEARGSIAIEHGEVFDGDLLPPDRHANGRGQRYGRRELRPRKLTNAERWELGVAEWRAREARMVG